MKRSHEKQRVGILTEAALLTGLLSSAYSQQPFQVDGVTPVCIHNQMHQVQNPGPGTLFPSPQYGYYNASIQYKCATSNNGAAPGAFYQVIPTACVGTFTSLADLQAQQASSLADLEQQLHEQLNILKASIKTLSDTSDDFIRR